ncbi:MAG: hypothetical protein HOC74_04725 [Gemmatimonadetes bacterium]|jgi:hypothetical protein|nr:hypothetical protein [Gemmatimonadota bacterium]
MTKNIFIVEGLPGVGKSYFCEILQQEIRDKTGNKKILFFEERDMDHPFHHSNNDTTNDIWSIDYRDYIRIVEDKCHDFFCETYKTDEIYIFDCGLLQRPLFFSMIASNFSEEATFSHLLKMYGNYENLPCQLFYLESKNFMSDFESIYRSRGSDYRDSIESVWNKSKYGMGKKLKGSEGAMEVLKYFKELKERFLCKLDLLPVIIDNTVKKPDFIRNKIKETLWKESQNST